MRALPLAPRAPNPHRPVVSGVGTHHLTEETKKNSPMAAIVCGRVVVPQPGRTEWLVTLS